MKKEFITYEQALAVKELGFDEPCFGFYDESLYFPNNENQYGTFCNQPLDAPSCSAPTFSQAFRWFREKEYYSEITTECTEVDGSVGFSWRIWKPWTIEEWSIDKPGDEWSYETYEEAEQACLDKLIEMTKNK
jgi:hypothetical protein